CKRRRQPARIHASPAAQVSARHPVGVLVALTILVLVGCGAEPPAAVSDTRARIGRLREAVSTVAEVQRAADDELRQVVSSIRDLEHAVVRLRSTETIDAAVEEWPQLSDAWPDTGAESVRKLLRRVALEVDDAR